MRLMPPKREGKSSIDYTFTVENRMTDVIQVFEKKNV